MGLRIARISSSCLLLVRQSALLQSDTSGPGSSTGARVEHTRAAIISVESDFSQAGRSWQHRHAFTIYCIALFFCL